MPNYGITFQPSQPVGGGPSGRNAASGVQQAVQLLSLRLPTLRPEASPIPSALLSAPGAAGLPGSATGTSADALIKQLLAMLSPQTKTTSLSGSSSPQATSPDQGTTSGAGGSSGSSLSGYLAPRTTSVLYGGAAPTPRITPLLDQPTSGPSPTPISAAPAPTVTASPTTTSSQPFYPYEPNNPYGIGLEPPGSIWDAIRGQWVAG